MPHIINAPPNVNLAEIEFHKVWISATVPEAMLCPGAFPIIIVFTNVGESYNPLPSLNRGIVN